MERILVLFACIFQSRQRILLLFSYSIVNFVCGCIESNPARVFVVAAPCALQLGSMLSACLKYPMVVSIEYTHAMIVC